MKKTGTKPAFKLNLMNIAEADDFDVVFNDPCIQLICGCQRFRF